MIQSVMVGKERKNKRKEGNPAGMQSLGYTNFLAHGDGVFCIIITGYEGVVGSGGRGVLVMSHCWKPSTDIHHAVYKNLAQWELSLDARVNNRNTTLLSTRTCMIHLMQ